MGVLNDLAAAAYANAKSKGFHGEGQEVERGTRLMLITSELAEALDADRAGKFANLKEFEGRLDELKRTYNTDILNEEEIREAEQRDFINLFKSRVKDTHEDEIADALIRIFDYAGTYNIDLDKHVALKMRYNATRERLHGKKY